MPPPATPFLGTITEVCIVTPSHVKTMDGLLRLGIGPFQVFDFTPATVSARRFRGEPGDFELRVCFAKQGDLVFEIMEPVGSGSSLMGEWLREVGIIVSMIFVRCAMSSIVAQLESVRDELTESLMREEEQ